MVLEGASAPPESDPFAPDRTPSSDLDPYEPNAPGPYAGSLNSLSLSMDLPAPVPVFGTLMGYTKPGLSATIGRGLAAASQVMGRPVRKEEVEALAYNIAKMERTTSWGGLLGLSGGLYRSWSTAESFRFPFFKPDLTKFNPDAFAVFRGAASRAAIHSLRGIAYGSFGIFAGTMFAQSYAAIIFSTALMADPRLKAVNQAMKQKAEERSGTKGRQPQQSQPVSNPRSRDTFASDPPPSDDMSPQSTPYTTDINTLSDREMRNQEVGQRADEPQSTENHDPAYRMEQSHESREEYDDMSPQTRYPQESSWDRVRRQSASGQQQSPAIRRTAAERQRPGRPGNPSVDSFSFSGDDRDERQQAKEEAQREFDARLERERLGKDFEDGAGGKRW